jgi:diaminopimelate epimerase
MDIWNADGSTAEMCGNGIRAAALFLHDHQLPQLKGRASYRIETGAGVLEVFIDGRQVRVNMGSPRLIAERPEKLEIPLGTVEFWEVNMGNPHAVIFVNSADGLDSLELEKLGPLIERHPRFPKKTNVEFVHAQDPHFIRVRVWERGAGITLACGTGACASAVASIESGVAKSPLVVKLPGGDLRLEWDGKTTDPGSPVWMIGPAVEVYRGMLEL